MESTSNLYIVYWKNKERKTIVEGNSEEEAIKNAKRFSGEYVKNFEVEKISFCK